MLEILQTTFRTNFFQHCQNIGTNNLNETHKANKLKLTNPNKIIEIALQYISKITNGNKH